MKGIAMVCNREAVLAALISLLRILCQNETLVPAMDTPLETIPEIDSLILLQVVAHLEEQFLVEIDVVAIDSMEHVGDIVNAICAARPQQHDAGT